MIRGTKLRVLSTSVFIEGRVRTARVEVNRLFSAFFSVLTISSKTQIMDSETDRLYASATHSTIHSGSGSGQKSSATKLQLSLGFQYLGCNFNSCIICSFLPLFSLHQHHFGILGVLPPVYIYQCTLRSFRDHQNNYTKCILFPLIISNHHIASESSQMKWSLLQSHLSCFPLSYTYLVSLLPILK